MALNPDRVISQYVHKAWRIEEGNVHGDVITQTTDGYIWIGTEAGLVRFDGVTFSPWSPPGFQLNSQIDTLLATRDGGLWVLTGSHLLRWKDGVASRYHIPPARYNAMLEDDKGIVWIARSRTRDRDGGLCRFQNNAFSCLGAKEGFPSLHVEALAHDSGDGLWTGSSSILIHWRPGLMRSYTSKELQRSRDLGAIYAISAEANGSAWVGIGNAGPRLGLQHLVNGEWKSLKVPGFDSSTLDVSTLTRDRNGDLWIGTLSQGLFRIHGSRIDRYQRSDGLSSNDVTQIMEDHEGNIWVTTTGGLDCFKNSAIATYSMAEGLSADSAASVVAADTGTVWVGNHDALDWFKNGRIASIRKQSGLPGRRVTAMLQQKDGTLWVGVDQDIYVYDKKGFSRVTWANGESTGVIQLLAEDVDRTIWAKTTTAPATLLKIKNKVVKGKVFIPSDHRIYSLTSRSKGGLWIGLERGNLAVFLHERVEGTQHAKGIDGAITDISEDANGRVIAATASGVIVWDQGQINSLTTLNGLPCNGVISIIEDQKTDLWLYAKCGLISIPAEQLQLWSKHHQSVLKTILFDSYDGARPSYPSFSPGVARSPDGKLWFVSDTVLQMFDPMHFAKNRLAPPVHITDLIADRTKMTLSDGLNLAPMTREIEIDYTALSFVSPEKVRFKYRLSPYDRDWHEPVSRRQAFYNNLRPGKYRFSVIACNNDGVWNDVGDSIAFTLLPAFHQTIAFRVLLALFCVAIFFGIHLLWLRQATARLQARLGERSRIARELHDTLIQSVDGLMIYLQAAINEQDAVRSQTMLVAALDRADEVLAEGRERITALRSEAKPSNDLLAALEDYGQARAADCMVAFSSAVEGTRRPLDLITRDEAFRIGREALANAFQHSGASHVDLLLKYARKQFQMTIRDNGQGIESKTITHGKPGHWGLHGMRERSSQIGGRITVSNHTSGGTDVTLLVPSRVAYRSWLSSFLSSWIRKS